MKNRPTQKIQNPNQTSKKKQTKTKKDYFRKIKYMGYCMSHLPREDSISLDDMVKFAKFQLCLKNKVLMKDPIWDDYTREEIMAEFYAHQFSFSEKAKLEFEASIKLNESG